MGDYTAMVIFRLLLVVTVINTKLGANMADDTATVIFLLLSTIKYKNGGPMVFAIEAMESPR